MRSVALIILSAYSAAAQSARYERARDLLATGHAAEAAAIYHELSAGQPDNPDLFLNASIAEYKAGHFREAAESATAAIRLAPDLLPARLFLGASLLELGEFTKAIEPLERVVAVNPREHNGLLMLGEALLRAGQHEAAIEPFQRAAEILPSNPRAWSGLAKACDAAGRKELAEQAWRQLMNLPPSLESHVHGAEVNSAAMRWREAAVEWGEALKLAPENLKIRTGLAWAQFRSRDYEAAIATLKPMPEASGLAEIHFLYGASLLNLQRPEEALPHLKITLARDPKFLPARAAMGQALLQTGKAQESIPFLKEALSVDQDGTTHFQLFRAYQLCKRTAEAKQAFAEYQRLRESLAQFIEPAPR
jgi:predicted Zn-dependent protease